MLLISNGFDMLGIGDTVRVLDLMKVWIDNRGLPFLAGDNPPGVEPGMKKKKTVFFTTKNRQVAVCADHMIKLVKVEPDVNLEKAEDQPPPAMPGADTKLDSAVEKSSNGTNGEHTENGKTEDSKATETAVVIEVAEEKEADPEVAADTGEEKAEIVAEAENSPPAE
jgi:hypothetical protein